MIQVAIAGINSELGQAIAHQVNMRPDMMLSGGTTIAEHLTGTHASLAGLLDGSHVLVDVTTPAGLMRNVLACLDTRCALVGGAGPLDPNHVAELQEYGRHIPVFYAPNLCVETAALLRVLPELQRTLPYLSAELTGVDDFRRRYPVSTISDLPNDPVAFLAGGGQEIMLSQKVYGPEAPARGAIDAIQLLAGRERGFFTMDDLLTARLLPVGNQDMAQVS